MSTQGSSAHQQWNLRDAQRGGIRDLDLNYPPPRENMAPTGPLRMQAQGSGHSQGRATTAAELLDDDDVVVISPRKFEEARNNARRNHSRRNGRGIEGFSEELTNLCTFSQLGDLGAFNWELSFAFDIINKAQDTIPSISVPPVVPQPQSVPLPEAPTFTCAICMGQLIEETSTKCGHIFCKECIDTAIATQHKCPTCRHKLRKRDTIRVYLPNSSSMDFVPPSGGIL